MTSKSKLDFWSVCILLFIFIYTNTKNEIMMLELMLD